MTAEQIRQGHGLILAAQTEHRILLELLVKGIDYASEVSAQRKLLTRAGEAGISRLKELFHTGEVRLISMQEYDDAGEYASDSLTAIWTGLFFCPKFSEKWLLIYGESAALICDMLGGGWFV